MTTFEKEKKRNEKQKKRNKKPVILILLLEPRSCKRIPRRRQHRALPRPPLRPRPLRLPLRLRPGTPHRHRRRNGIPPTQPPHRGTPLHLASRNLLRGQRARHRRNLPLRRRTTHQRRRRSRKFPFCSRDKKRRNPCFGQYYQWRNYPLSLVFRKFFPLSFKSISLRSRPLGKRSKDIQSLHETRSTLCRRHRVFTLLRSRILECRE